MRFHLRCVFYLSLLVNGLAFLFILIKENHVHIIDKRTEILNKVGPRYTTPVETERAVTPVVGKVLQIPLHNGTHCDGLSAPGTLHDKQVWTKIDDVNAYIFAAYYDDMPWVTIRIIGIREKDLYTKFMCQLWFYDDQVSEGLLVVKAKEIPIPEHHGRRFRAVFYICKIPIVAKPYAVSLVSSRCGKPSNVLPVLSNDKESRNFTICVTPLNLNYGKAYELIEFIELNRILGADKIIFYNYSTSPNVDQVLKWYTKNNLVELISWHLPVKVDTWPPTHGVEIHYFAQLAAANDCLYRNLHASRFLVYEDLDEFIVPRTADNWTALIDQLDHSPSVGGYIFRNTFFRKEWNDTSIEFDGKSLAKKYRSTTLLKLAREIKILPVHHRSKYIIQPTKIEIVGIHNICRLRPGSRIDFAPIELALLHHYRNWEKPDDKQEHITDDMMMKYKDRLLTRLDRVWTQFEDVPMDLAMQ